jgi:hypothetical protein
MTEAELERRVMEKACQFVLSDYPKDVDIMDIPTLVEFADQRVLIWEPFERRPANVVSEYIWQLYEMYLELFREYKSS